LSQNDHYWLHRSCRSLDLLAHVVVRAHGVNAVARARAMDCAGDTLVVLTARLVPMVMMVMIMVVVIMVVMAVVVVAVVVMTMVVVILLLATAILRPALVAALVAMMMVMPVVMTMVVAMMLLLLAVTVTSHAAIVVIVMMMAMMCHVTLQLSSGFRLRNAKSVTRGQIAGALQPCVGQLQILNSGVVDCGNVLAVVTILNHVLCLGCKTAVATGLGSAGGIHSHCLDRGHGHRAVLGVSLGVVNALGHRPGTDHGCRAHSGLDESRWIWDLYCARLCDCNALLAYSCNCWRWLFTLATMAMIELKSGVAQASLILIWCISCCNSVASGSSGNGIDPVEEALSIGQCQTSAQEQNG
jgi:hypothetical protein